MFNSTKRQNFGRDQIESKVIVAQTMISVFDRVENIVGKGENAVYHDGSHMFYT